MLKWILKHMVSKKVSLGTGIETEVSKLAPDLKILNNTQPYSRIFGKKKSHIVTVKLNGLTAIL